MNSELDQIDINVLNNQQNIGQTTNVELEKHAGTSAHPRVGVSIGYLNYIRSKITQSQINMIVASIIIATLGTLTIHIFIQNAVTPLIQKMQQEMTVSEAQSFFVIFCAYATAFITISLTVFLYYKAGHTINIKNKFLKILFLTAILLELKGALIREPFMNFVYNVQLGMKDPLLFSILFQLDRWIPNLFLSACLVYLCPLQSIKTN